MNPYVYLLNTNTGETEVFFNATFEVAKHYRHIEQGFKEVDTVKNLAQKYGVKLVWRISADKTHKGYFVQ